MLLFHYMCVCVCVIGVISSQCDIVFLAVPLPVNNLVIIPTRTSIFLEWSPPRILPSRCSSFSYLLSIDPIDGLVISYNITSTFIHHLGLSYNTTYRIRITPTCIEYENLLLLDVTSVLTNITTTLLQQPQPPQITSVNVDTTTMNVDVGYVPAPHVELYDIISYTGERINTAFHVMRFCTCVMRGVVCVSMISIFFFFFFFFHLILFSSSLCGWSKSYYQYKYNITNQFDRTSARW
jgi:hypothetical protein